MLLIVRRPKNKIPAFPAKAAGSLWFPSYSSHILKKAHFPAFPAFPVGVDTLSRVVLLLKDTKGMERGENHPSIANS